jgi:D-alanyl-lipoteichoic acid acyltransferase DltB (MBOAT superfamily)
MGFLHTLLDGHFSELTSFFSVYYLAAFLPAALLTYSLTPAKGKKYILLLGSLGFFFLISGKLVIFMLLTIFSAWVFGLWLAKIHQQRDAAVKAAEKAQRKAIKQAYLIRARWVLGLAALLHIGTLLVLKYSGFFMENVNVLLGLQLAVPSYALPIGISFFTLQAFSYLFDVYRGTQEADRNIFRIALFMAFFPQIVEGPICRYSQTANQLWEVKRITYDNLALGLQRILYGMMKKMVVADRLNMFVSAVFTDYANLEGGIIAIGAVCYTIQLYMDFSGAMDAVTGTAQIFGITMPENFQRPFFSKTISEFWTRWHISLGTWFKDYIFYPVTMSKPMKIDKIITDFLDDTLVQYDRNHVLMNKETPVYFTPDFSAIGATVFSLGVNIGEVRKGYILPHHQFFMAMGNAFKRRVEMKPDDPQLMKYLRGEEIDANCPDGWAVVTVDGCSVGGVKVVKGRGKNHYPKGLRLK